MILSKEKIIFNIVGYLFIAIIACICLMPFQLILSSSLSSAEAIAQQGYSFIPRDFSLVGYQAIFNSPDTMLRAYGVTLTATCIGTVLGLFVTSMTSYVLWRKDFPWRNRFAFFFYFTTLFSGGLVPWYILCVQYLKFKELPFLAIILPYLLNVFNILIIRNFMKSIPDAIMESAKIDGAGDFRIFIQLIIPLSKPALASIGLLIALGYWNDWYLSYLFVSNPKYFQLQFYLYKMISTIEVMSKIAHATGKSMGDMPSETMKMAMTIVVTGPIILLYPFLQKYFVKGLTIGAVKG